MRKKWIIIAIVIILIAVVIGISRCNKGKDQKAPAAIGEHEKYTVARGRIDSKIEVTGEVQPATIVSQKSRVSGKIVKFYVQENDFVKMGAILADIEPDYNQANTLFNTKASLQRAELALQQAQKDFADNGELLKSGYISQTDFDASRDALTSAEIQHAQASRQYEMIRDLDVPGTVIHMIATASGTVIERKVNEGEMVTSSINAYGEGTVVMQIANLSHMIVQSNINEVDIAKFSVGQKATIKLDALPYESYEGKIVKIAPKAMTINNAKVFPVEISINATGATAKPGMTAAISIQGESREDVIVIPIGAVFADDKNQDLVYVISADSVQTDGKSGQGKPEARVVKLGANDFQKVEIIENLKEGEVIMLKEPDPEMKMQFNFN